MSLRRVLFLASVTLFGAFWGIISYVGILIAGFGLIGPLIAVALFLPGIFGWLSLGVANVLFGVEDPIAWWLIILDGIYGVLCLFAVTSVMRHIWRKSQTRKTPGEPDISVKALRRNGPLQAPVTVDGSMVGETSP